MMPALRGLLVGVAALAMMGLLPERSNAQILTLTTPRMISTYYPPSAASVVYYPRLSYYPTFATPSVVYANPYTTYGTPMLSYYGPSYGSYYTPQLRSVYSYPAVTSYYGGYRSGYYGGGYHHHHRR